MHVIPFVLTIKKHQRQRNTPHCEENNGKRVIYIRVLTFFIDNDECYLTHTCTLLRVQRASLLAFHFCLMIFFERTTQNLSFTLKSQQNNNQPTKRLTKDWFVWPFLRVTASLG